MLQHLSVENYALINKLEITFDKGFSAITGETGAGKSILLGALSLILGNRADTGVLYDAQKKCVVEGTFRIEGYGLKSFFESNDLDFDEELLLRREINRQGKSRAFINDTPVKLSLMKTLGNRLVDIHSQNKTLTLNDSDVQLAVIDTVTGSPELLERYSSRFKKMKSAEKNLKLLREKEQQAKADQDYYEFLFNELEEASLQKGEQEEIEEELEIQNHSENIKSALSQGAYLVSEDDNSILGQLQNVHYELDKASVHHKDVKALSDRLNSSIIEIQDISSEMSQLSEQISYDPQRIEEINNRLSLIYELQQKHRVNNEEALLEKKAELQQKLNEVASQEKQIAKLEQELAELRRQVKEDAEELTKKRKASLPRIEQDVTEVLYQLGMPDANFNIAHHILEEPAPQGQDQFVFLFSANKGVEPQPISKIASGGELSRLMLSVKSLIANKTLLPTVIFDEIDSGVSGDIAGKTGVIMKKMAHNVQVIAITHLPQIAGKSNTHFFAYKSVDEGKTYSNIKKLSSNERVEELAKMLSDNKVTDAAKTAAKELMNS
ncbi:MAG: DNA repair protein RecN [Bacteroidota bacterium]